MNGDEHLEAVDKSSLRDDQGRPYREFRAGLRPRLLIVWRDILGGYASVAFGLWTLAALEQRAGWGWALAALPPGALWIGYWLAFLNLFTHEAAHHNLAASRTVNDVLANIFLSVFFGMSIADYRKIHWDHHRLHGTTEDTENSYFNAFTTAFLLRSLFGLKAAEVMRQRQRRLAAGEISGAVRIRPMLVLGVCVNLALMAWLAFAGAGVAALGWAAGMLMFYPFFNAVRQLLEHRDELAGDEVDHTLVAHGRINRIFGDSLLAQTLGGAGFNRHLLHHWEPTVSYTRLEELEEFLRRTPVEPLLAPRRTTYWDTARRLFRLRPTRRVADTGTVRV